MSVPALFKIAVSAFVVRHQKLLIVQRAHHESFLPGSWEVPGGGVEPGETITAATIREAQEEAGITVEPKQLFSYFEYIDHRG